MLPIGGGTAIFAGVDSPTNKMIGMGFEGALDLASLEQVEKQFADRSARLQAEVSTLADPSVHAFLSARGYVSSGFENVLGHPLSLVGPMLKEVSIEPLAEREYPLLADVLVDAFANPDIGGVGGDAIPSSDLIRQWVLVTLSLPGFRGYLARVGDKIAGGAAMRIDDRIAAFCGAGTLPKFRRRGVQTALIRSRLSEAAKLGCEVAVVVTQPASKSQQNAQREGFGLLYARQLLVKEFAAGKPPGQTAAV